MLNIKEECGNYYWNTDYSHIDNSFTMIDFLEHHLPEGFEIILHDGSYCEVIELGSDAIFILDAKGNGDFFNHVVNWNLKY